MKVYTRGYRPFIMGGNCHYFLATEVEASKPFDVGQGIQCRLIVAPNGRMFCAEAETGAIVGDGPDDVKRDMAEADPDVVLKQMAQARLDSAAAEINPPDEFWRLMRCL